MRYETTSSTDNRNNNRIMEFLTIFGVSILFTMAGMHYLKMTFVESPEESKVEIPYALNESSDATTKSVSVSNILTQLLP